MRLLPSLWEEFFGDAWPVGLLREPGAAALARAGVTGMPWAPAVEILDGPEAVLLVLELPGVRGEDIQVEVDGDVLTVKGNKPMGEPEPGQAFLRIECPYGPFERSFAVGGAVDAQSVTATYRDGLLRLRVLKRRRQPSRVAVQVE